MPRWELALLRGWASEHSHLQKMSSYLVSWLALANELRTASMDYADSEVRNIKGLLLGVA